MVRRCIIRGGAVCRGRRLIRSALALIAGRYDFDWQTQTDPDRNVAGSAREPVLNVSDLTLPASFTIGTRRQIIRAGAGAHVANDLWVARLGGFGDGVSWHVDAATLPAGSVSSFESD